MWNLLLYRRPRELEHPTISRSFFLSCERPNLLYSAVYAPSVQSGHKTSLHTSYDRGSSNPAHSTRVFVLTTHLQPVPRGCWFNQCSSSLHFKTHSSLFTVKVNRVGYFFCMLAWLPTFCRNPSRILLRIQNTRNAQVCRIHDTTTSNALTPSHPKTVAIISNAPVYPVEGCTKTCFRTSLRSVGRSSLGLF